MAAPARPVTQQDVSTSKVSSIKGGKVTLMVSSRLQALFKVSKETSALIPRHKVVEKTIKLSVRMGNLELPSFSKCFHQIANSPVNSPFW